MNTSLRKNQQGLAHVVLILLAVAALGAIGFVGYRVLNKDKTSSNSLTTQEAKEIEAECKAEIDDKDFCKFATNFTGLDDYSAVMEATSPEGSTTITIKTKGDSSQMSMNAGDVVTETISIGNTTYIKDVTDGKWTKYTSEDYKVEDIKDDIKIDFEEDKPEAERTQYKKVGKEDCGKLSCFKYQIIDPANAGDEQFIWFDDNDYLLRKWTFKNAEGSTTSTFTYGNVKISEPSPIKEPTAGSDQMPSEEEIKALMEQYGQ